jgi:hypothetical protein
MRSGRFSLLHFLVLTLAAGCGGDSNEPNEPFPDASGVYSINGGFDDIELSFTGTLEVSQSSRQSGALTGTLVVVDPDGNTLNGTLDNASVSTVGVLGFTIADPDGTWTFTGRLSGDSITHGRHTISDGSQSFSGTWQGTIAHGPSSATGSSGYVTRSTSLSELAHSLAR